MDDELREFNIRDLFFIIVKRWKLLLSLILAFTLTGFLISRFYIRPDYESSAMLIVNADQTAPANVVTYEQLNTAKQLVNTCEVILKSDTVLQEVIDNLGLNMTTKQLAGIISVSGVNETAVFNITVKYKDPGIAAAIANGISDVAPEILVRTLKASSVEIISPAELNSNPVSPNVRLNTLVSLLLGLFSGVVLSFLIEFLDNTFTTEENIQNCLEIPVLGVIPNSNIK